MIYHEDHYKIKQDMGKPRLSLVPMQIVFDIAAVREMALLKYHDPENWKRVEPGRYRDAALRHMLAYSDDPTARDADSNQPHLWHLATNIAFLCALQKGDFYHDA